MSETFEVITKLFNNTRRQSKLQSGSSTDCNLRKESPCVKKERSKEMYDVPLPKEFEDIINSQLRNHVIVINLDWLSFFVKLQIAEPAIAGEVRELSETYVIESLGFGTPIYNHSWNIYCMGEKVGMLHTHSKNLTIVSVGFGKLEITNSLLYEDWYTVFAGMISALNIENVHGITRLDIAIDGTKHIFDFLNKFARQNPYEQVSIKKLGKAAFDAKRMDTETMTFHNFKVGSAHKQVVVYNKSRELEKSNKEYIRRNWIANEINPEEVWRTELRLDSQAIKGIEALEHPKTNEMLPGINIEMLQDKQYLFRIFKSYIRNFFEFVTTDKNINRNKSYFTKIDLFKNLQLKENLYKSAKRIVQRGVYKAKMSIHHTVQCVLLNFFERTEDVVAAFKHLNNTVQTYGLRRYYEKKIDNWIRTYISPFRSQEDITNLRLIAIPIDEYH